ncbi:MAG: OprO/OprP family phosphate-selective porin [Prevotellaceae bacterium]|jgi:hypothetical protein|nr:OprO/OprP family phosphate-selective porin [Prevotellaceae bacterium]
MKSHLLLPATLLFVTVVGRAQETPLGRVINTLKERIVLSGYAQTGYTWDETASSNTFDIKRLIFMANGRITDRWSCSFMYDFASSGNLLEVYSEYRLLPALTVRVGQFKTYFSAENPLSPCVTELIGCYSQAVSYLAGVNGSDPLYGAHGGRDMGLLVYGTLLNHRFTYHLGLMNGQGINRRDLNRRKDLVGSLLIHPAKWASVGGSFILGRGTAVAASAVNPTIGVGQEYRRNRWAVSGILKTKPVDVRAELLGGVDGQVHSRGHYLSATLRTFPKFDVVVSYDYFNRNTARGEAQTNYIAGVQYHFYPLCRLQAQYLYCRPKTAGGSSRIETQLQIRF